MRIYIYGTGNGKNEKFKKEVWEEIWEARKMLKTCFTNIQFWLVQMASLNKYMISLYTMHHDTTINITVNILHMNTMSTF